MWGFCSIFSNTSFLGAGSDAILLGAETLRGLYPVETISIVGRICAEVYLFFSHTFVDENNKVLNVSFKLMQVNPEEY